MKKSLIAVVLCCFAMISCGSKPQQEESGGEKPVIPTSDIYVSPSGNDTAAGTQEAPFRTIAKALSLAKPGYTIYLKGGTWKERVNISVSGTEGKPVTLTAWPGEKPVLDGGDGTGWTQEWNNYALVRNFASAGPDTSGYPDGKVKTDGGLIFINGASHLVIRGIGITGTKLSGIYGAKGASDIVVEDCTVTDCVGPGICFGADNNPGARITIRNNYVKNCAQLSREAISLRTIDGFEVCGNTVEKVIKESIDAKSGSRNGSIHHNTVLQSGHCGIYLDAGFSNCPRMENIEVYCNEIRNPLGTGICLSSEENNDARNIRIYNNVVHTPDRYAKTAVSNLVGNGVGIKIGVGSAKMNGLLKEVQIFLNTVVGMRQQGIYVNYPKVENIVIANNISAYNDFPQLSLSRQHGLPVAQVTFAGNLIDGAMNDQPDKEKFPDITAGFVKAAPLLSDYRKGNLKLTSESPAVDAADSRYVANTDFAGRERPSGKAYDVGAYEFVR